MPSGDDALPWLGDYPFPGGAEANQGIHMIGLTANMPEPSLGTQTGAGWSGRLGEDRVHCRFGTVHGERHRDDIDDHGHRGVPAGVVFVHGDVCVGDRTDA